MGGNLSDPIDAVVTWVDGSDERHAVKMALELRKRNVLALGNFPGGHGRERYADSNEIKYCLYGIRRFMPWIRKIYLVTDCQVPEFLGNDEMGELGIELVDHQVVFRGYEWALPNFNSISIGTVLHRIPGLAGRYIYFNDDVIPVGASDPSDFFVEDQVVIRGGWAACQKYGKVRTLLSAVVLKGLAIVSKKVRSPHSLAQMRAARIVGFEDKYFHALHAPHAVRTETLRMFFKEKETLMRENIRHKFRHIDQFVAHPLAHHLEIAQGGQVERDGSDCTTINFGMRGGKEIGLLEREGLKFVCLQGLESAGDEDRLSVVSFLERKIFDGK